MIGALCLLVQDVYGVRPSYGVVLAAGSHERLTFSDELKRGLVRGTAEMRRILATGEAPDQRWVGTKCGDCGYHPTGWDDQLRLAADRSAGVGA